MSKKVTAAFDGGRHTSNGRVILLAEAEWTLEQGRTDVLVTDIWMPSTGCIGPIQMARARWSGMTVVAMGSGSPQAAMNDSLTEAVKD